MKNVISTVPRTLSHGENTTTNPCEIANVFNNYFASVAETAKQNINYSHKHFSEYLKHQCNNSVFIQPTDPISYLLSTSVKLVVLSVFQTKP